MNTDKKIEELHKYRDLVLATIDYYLDNQIMKVKTTNIDSDEHFRTLKIEIEEHFRRGRLTRLKQYFHDLTEMQVEIGDLRLIKYLQEKTQYDIDIFKSYFKRIEKIIIKGKISTDREFYDVNSFVNQLCQSDPIKKEKIEELNKLLANYENSKSNQK